MFQKSLPLALVAIAGCVALAPTAQKSDSTQTASPTSASSAPTVQKASPTPVPTPTPTPSPTPAPTPLPDNILKIDFKPVPNVQGLEWVASLVYQDADGTYVGKNQMSGRKFAGISFSTSGDMYIQAPIPSDSVSILCSMCDTSTVPDYPPYAIYKKTNVKSEFEFVAMGEKKIYGEGWEYVRSPEYLGKTYYQEYRRYDFTFSKLAEVASVSMAPWVVKSVDTVKKEVHFDTSVWPKNTGPLMLSDVASGDFFGQDYDNYKEGANFEPRCENVECENERALAIARERTAFTGTTAYFIGRAKSSKTDAGGGLYHDVSKTHTIFRVSETGAKEIVGRNIALYFAKKPFPLVHNFVYSQADKAFYVIAQPEGYDWQIYRISEDALVP